jgi:hypothetical protein
MHEIVSSCNHTAMAMFSQSKIEEEGFQARVSSLAGGAYMPRLS